MQETFTVASIVVALTELAKDLGVSGKGPLRLVAMVAGMLGQLLVTGDYSPQSLSSGFLTGLTTTGIVAFGKELALAKPSEQ